MQRIVRAAASALVVAAALVAPLSGSADASPSATALDMLSLHNQMRSAIGAPEIGGDARVFTAAQNHANYSSINGTGGHNETPGAPGFTGVTPQARVAAAGWSTRFVSEVAASYRGAAYAVTELWHAPYHRLGMMHPNAVATGWGYSELNGRTTTVGNLVYDFGRRPVEYVRSPAHGQVGVPASWSGIESPSPLPAGVRGPVGYPIMVVYSAGQHVTMRGATLSAPDGSLVPIYVPLQLWEYDYQTMIPQKPLAPATTYHVRMDLVVNGAWVTNEWDFTTAAADGSAVAPAPADHGYHSRWAGQSEYPTLRPGEVSGPLFVKFRNAGTKTWVRGILGQHANLAINGDDKRWAPLGVGWLSQDRVAEQGAATVAPGEIGTFTFQVRAPSTPGVYYINLRPVIDATAWMEDEGVWLRVTVIQ